MIDIPAFPRLWVRNGFLMDDCAAPAGFIVLRSRDVQPALVISSRSQARRSVQVHPNSRGYNTFSRAGQEQFSKTGHPSSTKAGKEPVRRRNEGSRRSKMERNDPHYASLCSGFCCEGRKGDGNLLSDRPPFTFRRFLSGCLTH